jgi:hypothetical protein
MKKIIKGFALFMAAGLLTACNDFLTEEPELKQSNEITLSKYSGLNNAGAALYTFFQSFEWYDGQFILQSELRGGNAKNPLSLAGSGRYRQDAQWNYTENSTSAVWAYAYYTISWANNILANVDGKTETGVSEQDWNNLKAEALFIRALCHFDLVTTYAQPYTYLDGNTPGVPVVLKTENGKPARNTVKEVYDQIVADLLEAEGLIGDNFTRSGILDQAAMVSKSAIQGLLSRVYLYRGEWQNAADYATKVINSGKYSLVSAEDYMKMWSAATAPAGGEIIFEVYGSSSNSYWDDSGWTHLPYLTGVGNEGSQDICATQDLVDLYDEGDIRLGFFYKNENDNICTKYYGKEGGVPRQVNVPIIRLAEMYLNRAEAISNGASVSGATVQSDLNAIASKRGYTVTASASVFDERRKELFWEGHIINDYARQQKSLTRTDFDGTVNKDVPFPNYRWAMPIPKRELDANPNMTQNEGY